MVITGNFTFDYSLKNIPNAPKSQIEKLLVDSIEKLINRMRWKLFWMKSPMVTNIQKQTFGFKSAHKAPSDPDLKKFEEDLIKIVAELEMKKADNSLQALLKEDMRRIKEKKEIIVSADKTDNHYLIPVEEYRRLMLENITKEYKRASVSTVNRINREAANIARDLQLDDRIEAMALKSSFLTVKDHKPDWPAKINCRLINPTKTNIGVISKSILDRINSDLRSKLEINQWRSSKEVLKWFSSLEDKRNLRFLKFDVEQFYPSITKPLMEKAIKFARLHTPISIQEEKILYHARKNVLMDCEGNIWEKISNPEFDVSMGSMDGAEISELIGIYMISMLMVRFNKSLFGIYRDDGLMVVKGGGPEVDRARKEVIRIFQQEDLKVTTECNARSIDFLDIIMDLGSNSTRPFIKPMANTKYVSTFSSHPPAIIKSIPDGVSRRLSTISSSKELFSQELPYYQAAMDRAGHKERLVFKVDPNIVENEDKQRSRSIIWFNPPWSSNIRTNVGAKFISLVRKHFPKSSPLYSIFNIKKLKVSYKTTSNMSAIIKSHNKKILSGKVVDNVRKGCNCRGGVAVCPMRGSCLDKSMIYKAEVTTTMDKKHYYGQTFRTFKERFYGHQSDLRNHAKAESTTLSKYVWQERNKGEEPEIRWSKLSTAKPYSLGGRSCPLCLAEKTAIARDTSGQMLNRRRELMNRCLHKDPHKLSNFCTIQNTAPPTPVQPDDDEVPHPVQHADHLLPLQPDAETAVHVQPDDEVPHPVQHADHLLPLHPVQPVDHHLPPQPAAGTVIHIQPDDQPHDITSPSQPVEDQLVQTEPPANDDVETQQPPDPPDLDQGVQRRSTRVCRRRYACLDMDSL